MMSIILMGIIKAIIFDHGNVIYRFDNSIFLRKITRFSNKPYTEIERFIYVTSGLPEKYEAGLIDSEQFFREIVDGCSLTITKDQFIEAYTNIFTPIAETMELIRNLKKKYRIGLISNTSKLHYEYNISKSPVFSLFDAVTVSFQARAMKPSPLIYRDCLKKLNLEPEECIFIDDKEKHALGAKSVGMAAVVYISHEHLLRSLRMLGVEI